MESKKGRQKTKTKKSFSYLASKILACLTISDVLRLYKKQFENIN